MKKELGNNKVNSDKRKSKFSEYQILIVSTILFTFQYSLFSVKTINFPTWIYLVLLIASIIINIIVKKANFHKIFKFSEFINLFSSFIVYLVLTFSVGLFVFGEVNNMYSKKSDLEFFELEIVGVSSSTSRSLNRIYFELNSELCGVSFPSSPVIHQISSNKKILNNSFLLLDCRKGLLGTYLIEKKEIIIK